MSPPRIDTLEHFKNFLLPYVSAILYLRSIYPREVFVEAAFHNTSVFQCRSPVLCKHVIHVIEEVCNSLLQSKVMRIGIEIYRIADEQVKERFVFDVSAFRVMQSNVRKEIDRERRDPLSPVSPVSVDAEASSAPEPLILPTTRHERLNENIPPDLSEQLRACLIQLVERCNSLEPLATLCSFNIYMELRSDLDAQLLTQRSKPWILAQSCGSETEQNCTDDVIDRHRKMVVPIRDVNYPPISFKTWIEIFSV
jgi:mitotic spindle assembly checkpoint protein MAD2B